jgi:hypothetical protein
MQPLTVPAFTVGRSDDGNWVVNLHDFTPGATPTEGVFQFFRSREEAERFAAAHRGKVQ